MTADERGAYVILEGREALGLSFAEACDDLTFIEKASRYRGRSPHLAPLRDYARCRMGLPLVESRGPAPGLGGGGHLSDPGAPCEAASRASDSESDAAATEADEWAFVSAPEP